MGIQGAVCIWKMDVQSNSSSHTWCGGGGDGGYGGGGDGRDPPPSSSDDSDPFHPHPPGGGAALPAPGALHHRPALPRPAAARPVLGFDEHILQLPDLSTIAA